MRPNFSKNFPYPTSVHSPRAYSRYYSPRKKVKYTVQVCLDHACAWHLLNLKEGIIYKACLTGNPSHHELYTIF